MKEAHDDRWNETLNFLCDALLGPEIYALFQVHRFQGSPVEPNEKLEAIDLHPFEKRLYDLTDSATVYLRENAYVLPRGEGDEKIAIAQALKQIFWAMLKLNHPSLFKTTATIGIRERYQIVQMPSSPEMPFFEIPMPRRKP